MGSFNLLWSVFHEWVGMLTDIWRAPWQHKLSYLLREPGWSHDGSRETSDMIRIRWLERTAQPGIGATAGHAAPAIPATPAPRNPIAPPQEAA